MALVALLLMSAADVAGQQAPLQPSRPAGRFGAGLQAGPFSGFSAKYYREGDRRQIGALVLTVSAGLRGHALVQLSALGETPLVESPLTLYLGPGVVVDVLEGDFSVGAAGVAGVRFVKGLFEIYLDLAPRILLLPDLTVQPAAGVGFRIYP